MTIIINIEPFYNIVVDQIVNAVWEKYPENVEARLKTYDRIAESFAAMARVLRVEKTEKPVIQIESKTEEPENEESST